MKKILLIAALAFASFTGFAQNKFAYVNFTELVQLMPESDEARATISASSKEAQETFEAMAEEFESKYAVYQQKVSTWTQTVRADKEKELTDIQTRIQDFQTSIQQELQMQQQSLMAPIVEKATQAVEKLAKEGGYIMVFEEGTVLYLDKSQCTDLTPVARKALGIAEGRTLESLEAELQAMEM